MTFSEAPRSNAEQVTGLHAIVDGIWELLSHSVAAAGYYLAAHHEDSSALFVTLCCCQLRQRHPGVKSESDLLGLFLELGRA